MSEFRVGCPNCQALVRGSSSAQHLQCLGCGFSFPIEAATPVRVDELATTAAMVGTTSSATPPRDLVEPPRPAKGILVPPRPRKAKPKAPGATMVTSPAAPSHEPPAVRPIRHSLGLWLGMGAAGLVVLGVVIAILRSGSGEPAAPPASSGPAELVLGDAGKPRAVIADKKGPLEEKKPAPPTPSGPDVAKKPPIIEETKPVVVEIKKEPETPAPEPPPVKDEAVKKEKVERLIGPVTPGLKGAEPERIGKAVLMGASYLRRTQLPTGSWSKSAHGVGHAALGGLTLLECKLPASDPGLQRAAAFVRANAARLDDTYDLSLAVLFLDRLGDARDKTLIQGLALRLVAGQNDRGGWDYKCPLLTSQDMYQLLTYLQKTQPKVALQLPRKVDPFQPPRDIAVFKPLDQTSEKKVDGKQPSDQPAKKDDQPPRKGDQPSDQPGKKGEQPSGLPAKDQPSDQPAKGVDQPAKDRPSKETSDKADEPGKSDGVKDEGKEAPKDAPPAKEIVKKDEAPPEKKETPTLPRILPKGVKGGPAMRPDFLPPALRDIPAVAGKGKGKMGRGRDDNSNSQFAMLALWAARKHGVPTERTLQFAGERYRLSQNGNGGWGYQVGGASTPSMTCAGLLGLATGIGTAPELPKVRDGRVVGGVKGKPELDNAAVDNGLLAVSRAIGSPALVGEPAPLDNLYFLWSVERVAMMYDLHTIGGKDWYGWGAQMLTYRQNADGSWTGGRYPGSNATIDTCFALLFLRRSNLADDLTENFKHFLVIRDPGER